MRILLVDDESKTAAYLRKGLAENGFAVDVASQGQSGIDLAHKAEYDLMVVNTMLVNPVVVNGMQEWPVFSQLRRSGKHTPVLFLAAGGRADGPVRGFSDFLTRIHSALGWEGPRAGEAPHRGSGNRPDAAEGCPCRSPPGFDTQGIPAAVFAGAPCGRSSFTDVHRRSSVGYQLRQQYEFRGCPHSKIAVEAG